MSKWPTVKLSEVCKIARISISPEKIQDGTLYVGLENITSEGEFSGVNPVDSGELGSSKFHFDGRHVLYGKLRPYLRKIIRPEFSGICSTDILPLLPGEKIDRNYIFHFLRTPHMVEMATTLSSGANLPRLSPKALADFEIPLPPLEEQRRIAAILDKADVLRQKRRQAIAKLDELVQAVFLEMFGDPVTNPMGWQTKPLGSLLAFLTSGSRGWAQYYADSGTPFLRIQNVGRGQIFLDDLTFVNAPNNAESRRTLVQTGDVLLSITADLGRTCVVPESMNGAFINQHLAILRPKEIDPTFLSSFICFPGGQQQIQKKNRGGVKAGLNFDDIRSINVIFPQIESQRRFGKAVYEVEKLKIKELAAQADLEKLFSSLQARAFAGEL